MVTVCILDDEILIRDGLVRIIDHFENVEIVGVADGNAALQLIRGTRPDLVLLDLYMPGISGFDILSTLSRETKPPKILVMSSSPDMRDARKALSLGAAGFISKATPADLLEESIRVAAAGFTLLSPGYLPSIGVMRARLDPADLVSQLTSRERAVLRALATGASNNEISSSLFVSVGTVKDHVGTILRKLGLDGRVQAAVFAYRAGMLDGE